MLNDIGNDALLTFHECCRHILAECPNVYAKTYAEHGLKCTDPHEVHVQALYILSNIAHWRSDMAREVRTSLKVYGGIK